MDLLFLTLHYPNHTRIRYEYSNEECIPYSRLCALASGPNRARVLLSFLDMESPAPDRYLPLRSGLIERVEYSNGRIFVFVTLGDYCHATDTESYASFISQALPQIYHEDETKGDWTGLLVEEADEEPQASLLVSTQESWINTARLLSKRRIFSSCFPVFTRMSISNDKGELLTIKYDSETRLAYHMRSDKPYHLSIAHYAPQLRKDETTEIHFTVQDGSGFFTISPHDFTIGNPQSEHEFVLQSKRLDDTKMATIDITCQEGKVKDEPIKYASASIEIDVESFITPTIRRCMIAVLVLIMTIATWILSLPVSEILVTLKDGFDHNTLDGGQSLLYWLCLRLDSGEYIYKLVCSFAVSLSTLFMIRLYGKPKLEP